MTKSKEDIKFRIFCSYIFYGKEESFKYRKKSEAIDTALSKYKPNIYLILKNKKITFDESSIIINNNYISGYLNIQNKLKYDRVKFNFVMEGINGKFKCDYPYNTLHLYTESEDSIMIEAMKVYHYGTECQDEERIGLDVMYAGLGIGKKHERIAIDRIDSHKKLQKIYSETQNKNPDSDISVLMMTFDDECYIEAENGDRLNIDEELKKNKNNFCEREIMNKKIEYIEAALIYYFKPEYNDVLKHKFRNNKLNIGKEIYDIEFSNIEILIDLREHRLKIGNNNINYSMKHTIYLDK